ncbi:hypothetical protein IFT48_18365 [Pseudomonas fluorescens]|uniref:hypothetical protein n=1 Tax=Pseudomonas fluorescens TaxID=294 RepID=UPI00190639F7|nr:hypothetical protein [Pseudomonas fluorescens]MBD8091963.1 hypothetical protein [Pseudomonas fluorescens]MBD8718280.1 hypothetical protein [Pseudomonas fluorescens]
MTATLAPWMVESAHKYLKASKILFSADSNLLHVASINAALGLEILLKSFIANVTDNAGKVNENYGPNKGPLKTSHTLLQERGEEVGDRVDSHDLLLLFYAIPEDVRRATNLYRQEMSIRDCRHTFAGSRYEYEADSPSGFSDTAIQALNMLVPNVVEYYKQNGCNDPWIIAYPNVP